MQIPAIKYAKEMEWDVIVADGNQDVPGKDYADYFEPIDLKNIEDMIKMARGYRAVGSLDAVFTAGTDFSETVARVAAAAGLPGITIDASINASNKGRMREVFLKNGISSPLFLTVDNISEFECSIVKERGLHFPLVVKPVDNMGSRGIQKSENCDELITSIKTAVSFSRSGSVILEEYLDGKEFSIDALVYDDKITICGFADRHIFYPPYFIEMGHTIPSDIDENTATEIIQVFKAGVRALGITEGAAKGDIRLSRGKIYIGEIAARLSGGYMSGWTFPYSSGVPLTKAALKIAAGQSPGDLSPVFSRFTAERAFLSIPGVVSLIEGVGDAKTLPGLYDIFPRVVPGDHVRFPENNVEKAGNCIAVSEDRSAAVKSAEEACRTIFVRLEACNIKTEEFLFGSYQKWVQNAFTLEDSINLDFLEKIPDYELNSSKSITILQLPDLNREYSTEWHGKRLNRAFQDVLEMDYGDYTVNQTRISTLKANSGNRRNGVVLGKIFYHAFLRGGIQGGVWVIDSALKILSEKKSLSELFSKWKKY